MATLQELVTMVTLRVDEYTEDIGGLPPEAPVGDIENELKQSSRSILRKMARHTAFIPSVFMGTATPIVNLSQPHRGAVVTLPDDYLRFISIRLTNWMRPVTEYVSDQSRIYKQQIYAQRRATVEKPVAALIPATSPSKYALEVFPGGDQVEDFFYVPYLEPQDMPEQFEDALVWDATASVLIIMRLPDVASNALAKAAEALAELNQGAYGQGMGTPSSTTTPKS